MVIVRAKGGLGNQLFQYAAGYSYAMRRNEKLYIDTSFYPRQTLRGYKLDKFNTLYESELSTSANLLVKVFCNKYVNKILRVLKISTIRAGKDFIYFLASKSPIMLHSTGSFSYSDPSVLPGSDLHGSVLPASVLPDSDLHGSVHARLFCSPSLEKRVSR